MAADAVAPTFSAAAAVDRGGTAAGVRRTAPSYCQPQVPCCHEDVAAIDVTKDCHEALLQLGSNTALLEE